MGEYRSPPTQALILAPQAFFYFTPQPGFLISALLE